ncbi:DMT family transporter [Neorhizobium galegae]|uniref:DMT family transporter n=1 Tax=Neorhizobium galegae TaxID=399 RepID=UPI00062120D5|nr:DMT family transporter [Neorhizobium galegae]CDZ25740.1 Putative transport protein; permease of the drug/metabolite transporter (DMT) superfamily [Neorhizobium galegae bv. officinalis]KAA9387405.1 DMT family transporter [Neorhizobium galegae]KAB1114549.1 DMT family transporter [Neorhizobium galegae]MCM2497971.1 DMT family transporter [Neorhizobium galegae]MCQ1773736.1 DMT family transporter [Neorhizobium galegae]
MTSPNSPRPRPTDWVIFALVPVFFSSNLIFGRGVIGEIGPFITAFIRWAGATLIIVPLLYFDWAAAWTFVRRHTWLWLWLGFLSIGISGGLVYWALTLTTASNATLIYTTSSLFIILFEWQFSGRRIGGRELLGMAVAFAGVAVIVLRGDVGALAHMDFNVGDLGMLVAAIAFAIYSLLLRRPAAQAIRPFTLFGLIGFSGSLLLLPPALWELFHGGLLPTTLSAWSKIAGIILFASLAAFFCFQHTVRIFGPATAGVTLYMMPPVSIVMAVIFLGETFERYHALGIVLVLGGIVLATTRPRRLAKP